MSLLNDVLRDLQTRGVFGVPPLAGLQAVSEIPAYQHKRTLLLPILSGVLVAAALVLWRPMTDNQWFPSFALFEDEAPAQPQAASKSDPMLSMQAEQVTVAATGDDLRELFGIDDRVESSRLPRTEIVADTLADSQPASTLAATIAPLSESPEVAESAPPIASVAVIESPPPAAYSAPAKAATATSISRHAPGADDVDGIVARARKAMRANDLFTAESMFRAALVVESGNVEIWSYLYSVLIKTSRPDAAERALQQGLVAADEPAALAKLYARMLLDRGEKDAAISILRTHRPPAAADLEYDSFLAALLQQQGQYADAGEIYETLLTVDPGSGSTWVGLAMSHDSLGNRADARAAFERALTTGSLKSPLARYARRRVTELKTDD
jgi:Flp pilus assembly protein TadD